MDLLSGGAILLLLLISSIIRRVRKNGSIDILFLFGFLGIWIPQAFLGMVKLSSVEVFQNG